MPQTPDLRTLPAPDLLTRFASARSGRLVLARLIRAVILQAHDHIAAGTEPPIDGNIRTFWYRWLKPIIARLPADARGPSRAYDLLIDELSDLVQAGRVSYASFGFADEHWENRRIGVGRPQVLVFTEKSGWIRLLRRIHSAMDVSVFALGGKPSVLSSEYTARDVAKAMASVGYTGGVHLVGLVDWDAHGAIVARSFADQLAGFGLPIAGLELLIRPEHFDAEELALFARSIGDGDEVAAWLADGGGVAGQALGLPAEAMTQAQAFELVQARVEQLAPVRAKVQLPRQRVTVQAWSQELGGPDADESVLTSLDRLDDRSRALVAQAIAGTPAVVVSEGRAVAAVVPVGVETGPDGTSTAPKNSSM